MGMIFSAMFSGMRLRHALNHQEGYREEDRKGLYEPSFRHEVILLHYYKGAMAFSQLNCQLVTGLCLDLMGYGCMFLSCNLFTGF